MSRLVASAKMLLVFLFRAVLAVAVFFARPLFFGVGLLFPFVVLGYTGIEWRFLVFISLGGLVLWLNNARVQDRLTSWLVPDKPLDYGGEHDDQPLRTLGLYVLALLFLVATTSVLSAVSRANRLRPPEFQPVESDHLWPPTSLAISGMNRNLSESPVAFQAPETEELGDNYSALVRGIISSFVLCSLLIGLVLKWLNSRRA